jgi:hypothetical protein
MALPHPAPSCVCAIASLLACVGQVDASPPELLEARFTDLDTLVLRFSTPMGQVADIDPPSHFRLGVALVLDDLRGGELTVYYDLAHHFSDGLPGSADQAQGPWPRHAFTEVTAIESGDSSDELRLRLSYPLESYVCDALLEAEARGIPAGIHLHYAEAGFPRVTGAGGEALADIGAWWVAAPFVATRPGAFVELDPRLPIPCPN